MDTDICISVIPRKYWIVTKEDSKTIHISEKNKKANLCARITTCVTDNFPQLKNCNENKFLRFQEQLNSIITQELKDND